MILFLNFASIEKYCSYPFFSNSITAQPYDFTDRIDTTSNTPTFTKPYDQCKSSLKLCDSLDFICNWLYFMHVLTSYAHSPLIKLGNGKVVLPYGSAEYIGLGFSVLCFLVVIELL